jgi:hypothetical protein
MELLPRDDVFSLGLAMERGKRHAFDDSDRFLILLLVGALPTWPYSSGWGYYPGGGLGLVLIIVLVLALSGRI